MSLQLSKSIKILVTLAALMIIFAGIKLSANMLVPFLLSLFIAIVCSPLVAKMQQYKVPQGVAIGIVLLLFVLIALSMAGLVGNSLNQLSAQIPQYRAQLKQEFSWLPEVLANYNIQISNDMLMEYFDPAAAMGLATNMLSSLGNVMANFFLILLTVVFMLAEASSLPNKVHMALDDPTRRLKQIDQFLYSVNHYLAIKTVVSIITGATVSFILWLFGLDFYLLWGVLAFLFNYIPNIGSIIAAVPAVLLAIIQLGLAPAGGIALAYFAVNTVMGNMVEPRYMGKGLGLSTLVVFLSLIFWGWLLGTVGMLLSVPLTMIIKIALESSNEGRWFAVLLGDQNAQAAEQK